MASRKVLSQLGKAFGRTAARRLTRGPKRPSWSFRYEWLVELLRIQFGEDPPPTLQIMRKVMDATGDREDRRRRSHTEWTEVAGMDAAWVTPLWRETSGTVLYLHGGGYALCSTETHRGMLSDLARSTGRRVLAVEYRKAPEHPFPVPIDDCVRAYGALLRSGVAPEDVVVAGDSAGGGLALALAQRLRATGTPQPRALVLLSPWVDLRLQGPSIRTNARYDYVSAPLLRRFRDLYLQGADPSHPEASPALADFTGLPPMLVHAGGAELLVSEIRQLAARARAHGAEVELREWDGMIHAWHGFGAFLPEAREAFADIGRFVHARFAEPNRREPVAPPLVAHR